MYAEPELETKTVSDRVRLERADEAADVNRRLDKRFTVPRSLVRVQCRQFAVGAAEIDIRDMLFGFVPALWTQRREVINLSKSGLAIESRSPVARGRKLRMQLWVSDLERPLELVGETRWCKRLLGRSYSVGVQFDAFGDASGANSRATLETLRQLEAKFG